MKVIIVEPGKFARIDEIETGLESYQHVVGGYIQMVYPWNDPVAIVCNEEGKIEGLPLNRAMTDENDHVWDIIAGTFFICGLGEEDCDSLSDELAEKYLQIFRNPHPNEIEEEYKRVINALTGPYYGPMEDDTHDT